MVIKSIFIPDTCLQNDKFSGHIMWKKDSQYHITMNIPKEIELIESYNADFTIDDNGNCYFNNIDVEGYIGLLFKSKQLKKNFSKCTISFNLKDLKTGNFENYSKNIIFFRPDIELKNTPENVSIESNSNHEYYYFSNKIRIRNVGMGTSFVFIELPKEENETNEIIKLNEIDEFQKRFQISLLEEFHNICKEYPEYKDDITFMHNFFSNKFIITEENFENIKTQFDKINTIFENDDEFRESLYSGIAHSYFSNINFYSSIIDFGNYIKKIEKNKIVIINALDFIQIKKGVQICNIKLRSRDLAMNTYPVISIPSIKIISDYDCKVPIYSIFQWNSEG